MRRILVLGGASEIGLAIAVELVASSPAEVLLAGRPSSRHRDEALAQVRAAGASGVRWLDFDATDFGSHLGVIDEAFDAPVDVAVVAFGVLGHGQVWRDHRATVELAQTNYTGALSVGVLLAQRFLAQGHGQIIAVSSVAGERVRRSNFVYGSSKAGMDGFYLQLGVELAADGVQVLVVRPGAVTGRMTAGRRPVPLSTTPGDVARASIKALEAGRPVVCVPAIFGPISMVFRNLPAWLVNRLPF